MNARIEQCITFKDLYAAFNNKKLITKLGSRGLSNRLYAKLSKILNAFLRMMIDDVIENNASFKLPTAKECYFELRYVDAEEFKHFRFRTLYPGSDPLRMNFHCVEPCLRFYDNVSKEWRYTAVILGIKDRERILQKIYEGKY